MSDLKTYWKNPGADAPGMDGSTVTGRGTDPLVTVDSPNGLEPIWNDPVPEPGGEETPNSVSGLPSMPNRFEPTAQPPGIPKLNERRLTIDERAGAGGTLND